MAPELVMIVFADALPPNAHRVTHPDSKVHGANIGPIWGRQDPGRSHAGPVNFAIWAFSHLGENRTPILWYSRGKCPLWLI